MKTTSKKNQLKNKDDLKNEDNLKNENGSKRIMLPKVTGKFWHLQQDPDPQVRRG